MISLDDLTTRQEDERVEESNRNVSVSMYR